MNNEDLIELLEKLTAHCRGITLEEVLNPSQDDSNARGMDWGALQLVKRILATGINNANEMEIKILKGYLKKNYA